PGWDDERGQLAVVLADLPPLRTLDVACGTGFLTRHLRGEVVGLDASERMLELARAQAPGATFVQGDALSLPFDAGAFDRVFTSYFYCHLEEGDRERFLAEARRVGSELVVVASIRREDDLPVRWDDRLLKDGSRWTVYKRVFEGADLAHELGEEEFYGTFYCASVTRCYPGRAPSGRGDRTPTLREQELCSFWRHWELNLLRPELIVPVGGLAFRRLLGLSGLADCIGRAFEHEGAVVVPLPH